MFAAVDHTGADVKLSKAVVPRKSMGSAAVHKPVTAGWRCYGDFQHTTEEAIRMNCRAVADHLTRLVDARPRVVFIVRQWSLGLLSTLPQRAVSVAAASAGRAKTRKRSGT